MLKITLGIDGMQCSMCEAHINDTIRRSFPVKKVTSSHSKNQTVILTEEDISEQELKNAIETAMNDKSVGIILLTEKFGREFPDLINEIKLERTMPLLIEIPDRHGTGRKKDFITSYVNEAIGLKL